MNGIVGGPNKYYVFVSYDYAIKNHHPYFKGENKAQGGKVICPRPHNRELAKLVSNLGLSDF